MGEWVRRVGPGLGSACPDLCLEHSLPGDAVDRIHRIPQRRVPVIMADELETIITDRPAEVFKVMPVGFGKDAGSMRCHRIFQTSQEAGALHGGRLDSGQFQEGRHQIHRADQRVRGGACGNGSRPSCDEGV